MRVSTVTQQIKNFALTEARMDKVGIASIDRFNEAPEGMHPTDFLPGCKSVIAFCTRLPDGAVESCYRAFEDGNHTPHGIYGAYGYAGAPNYNLLWANFKISRFVEKLTGCAAMPNTAGPTHGAKMMSMRHCAFAAGLGEFGWSSIILTPEFGPRNRFGAVLTTAELEPDPLYDGPRLCDPSKCHICEKMCPTGAIPAYSPEQARIIKCGDKEVSYGSTSWARCRIMCHGTRKEFNESGTDIVPLEMDDPLNEDLDCIGAYYNKHPRRNFWQHNPTWKCGNCLTYCPVGNWKERFSDTGLTSVDTSKFIDE
ncbi:MAG TPA: epoxyqueuosine reductase [Candidatus Aphodovivens avistercoris]|nr:epoxyqueuosine reductase [Candidatus Aphodovivens avistercoris]